jgi:hypothetical protein
MRKLNLEIIPQGDSNHLSIEATLRDNIVLAQQRYKGVRIIKQKITQEEGKYKCFRVDPEGVLWFNERIVVPKDHKLCKQNNGRGPPIQIFYAPWQYEDVPGSETKLLVDSYEMGNCQVCLRM